MDAVNRAATLEIDGRSPMDKTELIIIKGNVTSKINLLIAWLDFSFKTFVLNAIKPIQIIKNN